MSNPGRAGEEQNYTKMGESSRQRWRMSNQAVRASVTGSW